MSSPVAGLASMAGTVIGAGIQMNAEEAKGKSGYLTNMYQAGIAQRNAQIAEQNSAYALDKGETEAQRYGMSAANKAGNIKVAQSANGLDVNSGTNKSVQEGQDTISELDMGQIRSNAAKVAFDYRNQAENYRNSSNLYAYGALNSLTTAKYEQEATMIGAATSVADKWSKASSSGMFSGFGE